MQVATMFFHVGYRRLVGAVRDEKTAMAERCKRLTHMCQIYLFSNSELISACAKTFHNFDTNLKNEAGGRSAVSRLSSVCVSRSQILVSKVLRARVSRCIAVSRQRVVAELLRWDMG